MGSLPINRRDFLSNAGGFALYLSMPAPIRTRSAAAFSRNALAAGRSYDYQLCYIPCYGQSLSLGAGGLPALSLHQRFDSLMFAGGTIAQGYSTDLAQVYGSVVPLVENNNAPNFDTGFILYPGETPLSGAFEAVKELMASQDALSTSSITYKLLGSCPGQGGEGIAAFLAGTTPYERLMYEVAAAKSLAADMGLTLGVPALFWVQGESDGDLSQAEYLANLQDLFTSLNADILAATGQAKAVQFFTYQTQPPGCYPIACAQFQLSRQMANVHVATPTYPFQAQGDGTHLGPLSYKLLGAYFGSAYKRVVVNHDAWQPLSPLSIAAVGDTIVITLNLQGTTVVADTVSITTTTAVTPSLGFFLNDAAGNPVDIANAVAITGPAQITITSPVPIADGFVLGYGDGGGNIRDNYGDQYVFNGGGLQQPMHNWLTVFNFTFAPNGVNVALTATPNVISPGASTVFTATVTPVLGTAPVTGNITFFGSDATGTEALGTVPLVAGQAVYTASSANVAAGSYTITAEYSGSSSYASATSISVPVTLA